MLEVMLEDFTIFLVVCIYAFLLFVGLGIADGNKVSHSVNIVGTSIAMLTIVVIIAITMILAVTVIKGI